MPEDIAVITVVGIFGKQNIRFDLTKKPFFIVGPNGTGKSTALKILHCILTAQWGNLDDYNFQYIDIDYDDDTGIFVEKSDFLIMHRIRQSFQRSSRRVKAQYLYPPLWEDALDLIAGPQTLLGHNKTSNFDDIEQVKRLYEIVSELMNIVESKTVGNVLYFPTYRRIERDIGEFILETESQTDLGIRPEITTRFERSGEVVGFGGQDITALLYQSARDIDSAVRAALNDHSIRYLQILSREEPVDISPAEKLLSSDTETSAFMTRLTRYGNNVFDSPDVFKAISDIQSIISNKKSSYSVPQIMILSYISELITLFNELTSLLDSLETFASLLSDYLKPSKYVEFRKSDYAINIFDTSGYPISIDQLSSGEKQIVAFLAFLLLKSKSNKYIIIDEPELSLSVTWQGRLIADIRNLAPSAYIVAATHSPFIFENFDASNVESLGPL